MATGGSTISKDYQYEVNRINSFVGWPLNEAHKPEQLASVGFVYTGEGTLVQCFYCGIKYRAWHKGDNPLSVHQKCNPRCPFLRTLVCKQKLPSKQKAPSLKPHNRNNHGQSSRQAAVCYNDNSPDNAQSGSFNNTPVHETKRTKLLVGWALNEVVNPEHPGRQQSEIINMPIEAEGKKFSKKHFETLQRRRNHPPTISQSAIPLCRLPGHSDLMAFPDNSLPQQYCEESESESRGGIDPFKFDANSEEDQTHAEQVAAEMHVESHTVLSVYHEKEKKPLYKLSFDDSLKSCNVDFSTYPVDLKNDSAVSSSVSSSSDEDNKGTISQANRGSNLADNINYVNIICTVCYDRRKEYILLPCGHTTCEVCAMCIIQFQTSRQPCCPFCRRAVSGINRVFI